MIHTTSKEPTEADKAQDFLIQEARRGNRAVVLKVLKDFQEAESVESFLALYDTIVYLNIAQKVLQLKDIE